MSRESPAKDFISVRKLNGHMVPPPQPKFFNAMVKILRRSRPVASRESQQYYHPYEQIWTRNPQLITPVEREVIASKEANEAKGLGSETIIASVGAVAERNTIKYRRDPSLREIPKTWTELLFNVTGKLLTPSKSPWQLKHWLTMSLICFKTCQISKAPSNTYKTIPSKDPRIP